MPNPHGEFIWYELITPDPDGAKKFYDAVMGWDVGEGSAEHGGYREIRSGAGHAGGILPLTEEMAKHGTKPIWLGYIGVDDVDAVAASVEEGGGRVYMAPTDLPGIGRMAMVADPQGVAFYVMRGASGGTSTAYSPQEIGRCAWNELATSDPAAALDFYLPRFRWTKGEVMPMGDMGDYQFIDHAGRAIGAVMRKGENMPPRWRFYFRVPDADAARQAIEAGGGTIVHGPEDVSGGDRILIGRDPQGAEFAIVGK